MRVLVTGGYGFIGSFVAEKFYTEGHDVFIIDNLSTGNKNNVKFKHKFYQLSVEDPKCEEIFKVNKFDTIIHLAAQVNVTTSMENPFIDSQSNVLGLANILQLSQKYGVNKVVFASSAAIYGLNEDIPLKEDSASDPLSPYGINKWVGELYCKKWKEVFDVDTLCFRFSNVYGPKQGTVGEGGVVSIFIDRVLENQELTVFGDGEQTRDFIYVQDVAEAIYRGVEYDLNDVYNLSTNTQVSVNDFIQVLSSLSEIKGVQYKAAKQGDIKHSRLDNTKLKKDLDWVPLHDFQDGLKKTYVWFKENHSKKMKESPVTENAKKLSRFAPIIPFLENLMILAAVFFISSNFHDSLYMVDYQLFYIVTASFLLGRKQSILSIGLGSVWFVYANIQNGRELISLFVDHNTLVHIGIYMFVGFTIGYVIERKEKMISNTRVEVETINEQYSFLRNIFQETLSKKEELQNQVLYTNNSFGTVYSTMKELDKLEPLEIYSSSISITENVMKTNEAALYMIDSSHETLHLASRSAGLNVEPILFFNKNESLMEVKETKMIYVNKTLEDHKPSMISPILIDGNLVGILCIYNSDFEYLSLFYQNLMIILSDLISSSLKCAYQHQEAITNGKVSINAPIIKKEEIYA